ncbi:MAG: hypothetical protein U9P10_15670 [Thermodesulfobacteriota bacterium]|nr:hypothetical protein [Thermodesulfobacteriota bacterium]
MYENQEKMSITIDADIFKAVEKAAASYNIAKSHLAQEAFRLWFKKRTEELMARGYVDMASEDREFIDTSYSLPSAGGMWLRQGPWP